MIHTIVHVLTLWELLGLLAGGLAALMVIAAAAFVIDVMTED